MEIVALLAAVLLVAALKTALVKKHGKRLGMEKKRSRLRKDHS